MAERYNPDFDLEEIGEAVGYPLFMKPFDGGMWVGVTRITTRRSSVSPTSTRVNG